MAHKGKFYPLAFRRDFELNLKSYATGAAKEYSLEWHNTAGTIGAALVGRWEPLTGGDVNAAIEQEWFSDWTTVGIYSCRFRLWAEIKGMPQDVFTHVDIIELHLGLIYRTDQFDKFSSVGAFGDLSGIRPPLHQTPVLCTWKTTDGTRYEAVPWPTH